MTHIITSLCLRDSGCVDVCPVEYIVPGKPVEKWPWFYYFGVDHPDDEGEVEWRPGYNAPHR